MKATLLCLVLAASLAAADFRAGLGRAAITPREPIRMSGYAARKGPSQGVTHDLWAKALALEDPAGGRAVIVTLDLSTVPPNVPERVAAQAKERYGMGRERLVFNCSHTHSGPVTKADSYAIPEGDAAAARAVREYADALPGMVFRAVEAAMADLAPARLSFGLGSAPFAMNRREPGPKGYRIGVNPSGPTDHDVPVIEIRGKDGKLRGILFGYACHNTTLGSDSYMIGGDYAGFAQIEVEKQNPGATALFMALCGADQNPYPRDKAGLAGQHGVELAGAVGAAREKRMRPLGPPLRIAVATTELPFAPHTRETFEARLNDANPWVVRHAKQMLRAYDEGRPVRSMPYTVQALRFGRDLTMLFLNGEVVVDYALRAKREFRGEPLVVAGYSNDVACYIPSRRVLKEGGYEPVESMLYGSFPGPFDESVEETVFGAVRKALAAVGRR